MIRHIVERLALVAGAVALSSCAVSTPGSRIAQHPEDFARLTGTQQALVQQGRIDKGMPREAVYFAWGSPNRVGQWLRNGVPVERWTYLGHHPVYYHRFGIGAGWGHWGGYGHYHDPFWDTGIDVDYVPYTAARVDFRSGRVVAWESRIR